MIIAKEFYFESAHQLPNKKIYGKCSDLHGHSYKLVIEIEGQINKDGWIINFSELKKIVQLNIIDLFDHKVLNDFIKIPTAENILLFIKKALIIALPNNIKLSSLTLWETNSSYAKIICK